MYYIVGYSDWNTCSTGGDWTEAWTDSDGVADWSPTIILWGLPLHCEGHTVPTILLNSGGGSPGRRGEICGQSKCNTHIMIRPNYIDYCFHAITMSYNEVRWKWDLNNLKLLLG